MEFKVTRVGADTTLGKVRNLIADAERSKLPIMRMIDNYVGYYTPTILMIAGLVWFITGRLDRVIAVLVMAVPAALVIATPSAVIAAIAAASRLGILIKDVTHIELAAKIKAVVFDKTGTLTEGKLEVAAYNRRKTSNWLICLGGHQCGHHSNHPAAEAMRNWLRKPASMASARTIRKVAGKAYRRPSTAKATVGRPAAEGVDTSACKASGRRKRRHEHVCVARDNQVMGWIGCVTPSAGDCRGYQHAETACSSAACSLVTTAVAQTVAASRHH